MLSSLLFLLFLCFDRILTFHFNLILPFALLLFLNLCVLFILALHHRIFHQLLLIFIAIFFVVEHFNTFFFKRDKNDLLHLASFIDALNCAISIKKRIDSTDNSCVQCRINSLNALSSSNMLMILNNHCFTFTLFDIESTCEVVSVNQI
eukprot:793159_1